jgi:hypothetical protein
MRPSRPRRARATAWRDFRRVGAGALGDGDRHGRGDEAVRDPDASRSRRVAEVHRAPCRVTHERRESRRGWRRSHLATSSRRGERRADIHANHALAAVNSPAWSRALAPCGAPSPLRPARRRSRQARGSSSTFTWRGAPPVTKVAPLPGPCGSRLRGASRDLAQRVGIVARRRAASAPAPGRRRSNAASRSAAGPGRPGPSPPSAWHAPS